MNEELRASVQQLVVAMAPRPANAVGNGTHLVDDLGYDSLRLLELAIALEEAFGLAVTTEQTLSIQTVDEVETMIVDLMERNQP